IGILIGYALSRYSKSIYLVNARISTKKFSGKSTSPIPGLVDASFFLSNVVEVYEEIPILRMPKRFEKALEKVDLSVRYFSKGFIKVSESAYGYTFQVLIEQQSEDADSPYGVPIFVNHIDEYQFEIKINEGKWKAELSGKQFPYNETIQLGNTKLKVVNYWGAPEHNDKFYFVLNRKSDLVREYLNKLNIAWAVKGSAMLDLTILSETPEREIKFLHAYYQAVEELGKEDKNETLDNTLAFIDKQMAIITDSIVYYQELMDGLRLENRKLNAGSEFIFSRLNELDKQRTEISLKERYLNYLEDYFKANSSAEVFAPSMVGLDIPLLENWINRFVEKKLVEKHLRNESNALNPLINRTDSLSRRLELGIFEAIKTARERNKEELRELVRQENFLFESVQEVQSDYRELNRYQRLYELNQSLFDLLIRRKIEVDISKASASSDYQIIDYPAYSKRPVSPDKNQNLIMAAALGLMLPVFFFLFKDLSNTRVMDKDDLQAHTVMPILGNVAHSKFKTRMVVKEYPRSVVAESFRSVRANLRFLAGKQHARPQVYVITSSVSGEGKTFCSINLAFTLALSGKKTILIGADMRKPELANYSGIRAAKGLSEYLAGFASWEEVIIKAEKGYPDMIDAGRIPPNPSELLGGEQMAVLIDELKKIYNYILIDTPPIGLVSDAMELFKFSDYNILIVRQGETRKAALKMVNDLYIEDKLSNFLVV
ncbi:MAG TPA: polysaccharide biosynthesis tyrosine autokinase, partial [Cyclobacteriaceae bacterium]|nr:polysaccharide biosynthesis tyrosine autokinase [Cyclobacteriaceae bacterium]